MTAPDQRLDEIQARLDAHYESIAYADDIAEGSEDLIPEDYERHYCAEDGKDWPCPDVMDYAQEDIRYLLAELRKAHEALARVEGVATDLATRGAAIEAKGYNGSINSNINEGRSIGYLEGARLLRAAVAAANGDGGEG